MKNPWVIIGVITVVLFGGAIWLSSLSAEENNVGVEILTHVKGNPEAEVKLVEYSDFECPACASFQPILDGIFDQYADQLSLEFRHFPLPMHRYAMQAAIAAEAAGQQGKFFEYHDLLFAEQQNWANNPSPGLLFVQYAEQLELDVPLFKRHLKSSVLQDKVRAELNDGRTNNVDHTPTFYLNGREMEFETFQSFIEQITFAVDPSVFASSTAPVNTGTDVRFGL